MTNRTKTVLLLLGFLAALILCYKLAISKTVDLKATHDELKAQEALFSSTPKQMSLLKQKQRYYDSLLVKYQLQGSSLQNNLLRTVNRFADSTHLKIIRFLEPHVVQQNDLKANTYQFTLEGNFNAIIQLIHKLEQETKFGEVTSVRFEKLKNHRTGKYYLQVHILLKSFG